MQTSPVQFKKVCFFFRHKILRNSVISSFSQVELASSEAVLQEAEEQFLHDQE